MLLASAWFAWQLQNERRIKEIVTHLAASDPFYLMGLSLCNFLKMHARRKRLFMTVWSMNFFRRIIMKWFRCAIQWVNMKWPVFCWWVKRCVIGSQTAFFMSEYKLCSQYFIYFFKLRVRFLESSVLMYSRDHRFIYGRLTFAMLRIDCF